MDAGIVATPVAVKSPPAAERVYLHVKAGVLDRSYEGGTLLTEGDLAEAVGVSRTPVREALLRLEAEGLLKLYPKKGALVLPVSAQEIADVVETRLLVEQHAVAKVVGALPERLVARLEELLGRAARARGRRRPGGLRGRRPLLPRGDRARGRQPHPRPALRPAAGPPVADGRGHDARRAQPGRQEHRRAHRDPGRPAARRRPGRRRQPCAGTCRGSTPWRGASREPPRHCRATHPAAGVPPWSGASAPWSTWSRWCTAPASAWPASTPPTASTSAPPRCRRSPSSRCWSTPACRYPSA